MLEWKSKSHMEVDEAIERKEQRQTQIGQKRVEPVIEVNVSADEQNKDTFRLEKSSKINIEWNKVESGPSEPAQQKQAHEFGTYIDDIYDHSWSNPIGIWLWVPKRAALRPELGFPASESEVR